MLLETTLQMHQFLLPFYRKVAKQKRVFEKLRKLNFFYIEDSILFSPLTGLTNLANEGLGINLRFNSLPNFVSAIGINFLKYDTDKKYVDFVLSNTKFFSFELHTIAELLSIWYQVSQEASIKFFNTEGSLTDYFRTTNTVSRWWTKDRTDSTSHRKYQNILRDILHSRSWNWVLEIGAGFGRNNMLYEKSIHVVQGDLSFEMLDRARSDNLVNFYQVVFDANNLPFVSKHFDLIAMIQVAMHLSNPFSIIKTLLDKFLSDSGKLLVDFTCLRQDHHCKTWLQKSPITRLYSYDYLLKQMHKIGAKILVSASYKETNNTDWRVFLIESV